MAALTVSATTAAATVQAQVYSQEVFHEAHIQSFWRHFMGEGSENIIQVKKDLTRDRGDRVNMTFTSELTSKGRVVGTGNTSFVALEGSVEQSPNQYAFGVTVDEIIQVLGIDGRLNEQRAGYDIRKNNKMHLVYWLARAFDEIMFNKLSGVDYTDDGSRVFGDTAVANSNVLYGGGKASKALLTSADTFSPDLLSKAKVVAQKGSVGGSAIYKMKPLMIDGSPYYMCVISPEQNYDLRQHADWKEANLHARERAQSNPIFSGANSIWDGVLVFVHDLVATGSDAGAGGNVDYADALFLGQQAGVLVEAANAVGWVEKTLQLGTKYDIAVNSMFGFQKTRFNSIDFSTIKIETAAAAVA